MCHAIRRSVVDRIIFFIERELCYLFLKVMNYILNSIFETSYQTKLSKSHYLKKVVFKPTTEIFLIAPYIHIFTSMIVTSMYVHLMSIHISTFLLRSEECISIFVLTKTFALFLQTRQRFLEKIFEKKQKNLSNYLLWEQFPGERKILLKYQSKCKF